MISSNVSGGVNGGPTDKLTSFGGQAGLNTTTQLASTSKHTQNAIAYGTTGQSSLSNTGILNGS